MHVKTVASAATMAEASAFKPFESGFVEDNVMIARTGYTGEDGGVDVAAYSQSAQARLN